MARRSKPDPKPEALRAEGCLNPRPDAVLDAIFRDSDFFDARDLVQVKYEMLRRVRIEGRSVTESSKHFGFSRPTFYESQAAFVQAGLAGLLPRKRGPRHAHKLSPKIVAFLLEQIEPGQPLRAPLLASRVRKRFGLVVHPRSIERAVRLEKKKQR